MLYELPAGYMDKGEVPEETAERELLEETGYKADSVERIGELYVKPSRTNKVTYVFLAKNAKFVSKQKIDESEKIDVVKVSLPKLVDMVGKGEIRSSDTIASIMLALN